ncbi:hypothetical protein A2154_01720 [Candidatus Gottesmanbacteria bacterium RBG_16_43_7]|uniref:Uncharacterized protein n=1 Tax=Candidatus Gottesmanbacteria bacterium RBG_16_43_7 TaxID=1798373 RepID=A0A1F5Z888_9BACT|nr:MAG: hypothetical protein A2154_01720 [Candidatus Gottesmanbacteria bacterium RBG_16_43_7]
MYCIISTIVIFILTVFLHLYIHKLAVHNTAGSIKAMGIFVAGFATQATVIYFISKSDDVSEMPIAALFLFLLLTLDYIAEIASPLLGDESPSSKIILMVMKSGGLTKAAIMRAFSYTTLINKRLDDMVRSGWIRKSGKIYFALPKGKIINRVIDVYRKLINWKTVG